MSSTTAEAWGSGRPLYYRLPGVNEGYRQEDTSTSIAAWLTEYWDDLLVESKATADDLPRQLDPALCDPQWLDFLAPLCGFVQEYWEAGFPEAVKRSLLINSYNLIWANKGSQAVLAFLLNTFGINHSIWLGDSFVVGETTLPGTIGSPAWQFYILLTLEYLRESPEFARAEQLRQLYSPAFCDSLVAYDQFYVGFSVCGDPVFGDAGTFELLTDAGDELLTQDGQTILGVE
jgi:hypothetical protein